MGTVLSVLSVELPGRGNIIRNACESFDDATWAFTTNAPKSEADDGGLYNAPYGESNKGYTGKNGSYYPRLSEDGWRGQPDIVERTTNRTACGAGALRIATQYHTRSSIDSLSWQQAPAVTTNTYISPLLRPSATVCVYVPEPSTWQGPTNTPFELMGFVLTTVGSRWPSAWVTGPIDGGRYSWNAITGSGDPADPFVYHSYTNHAYLEITSAGWWVIGSSIENCGMNWFIRKGLGPLDASHYLGTYRSGQITNIANLPGGTIWIENTNSSAMSPDWIVDELMFYCIRPGSSVEVR